MKNYKVKLLGLAILSLTIINCSNNDDDDNGNDNSNTSIIELPLTKTSFGGGVSERVESAIADTPIDWNGDGVKSTDVYAQMEPCEKDNNWVFDTDDYFEYTNGYESNNYLKCNPTDLFSLSKGTWTINQTNQTITIKVKDKLGVLHEQVLMSVKLYSIYGQLTAPRKMTFSTFDKNKNAIIYYTLVLSALDKK